MIYPFLESFARVAYPCYWRASDGDFWMNDAAADVDNPLYRENIIRRLLADIVNENSPGAASPWVGSATRLWGLSVLPLEGGLFAAMTGRFELPATVVGGRLRESINDIFYSLPHIASYSGKEAMESLESTQRSCYTLLRLVNNLENAAAAANVPKELSAVDFCQLLQRTVDSVKEVLPSREIPLALSLPEETIFICVSARLLGDAVLNILRNSLQYTRDENRVHIKLGRVGKRARLTIEDAGLGIRPENLGRIFEPYFSADPYGEGAAPGLGLGLAAAREIVLAHGGAIACESRFGEGTTISLSLPLHNEGVPLESVAAITRLNRFSPEFIQLEGLCLPPDVEM